MNASEYSKLSCEVHKTLRFCRTAWKDHDSAELYTSTNEKDACLPERLGKAASVLRQGKTFFRVYRESRELRVRNFFEDAWRSGALWSHKT